MFKFIFFLCFSIFLIEFSQGIDSCGDWTPFKDIKCFKVMDKKVTEEEAVNNCTKLDSHSTLVTIHSQEEQDFIKNLLIQKKVSNVVWIGFKYIKTSFEWLDGSNSGFNNWDRDALKDGSLPCVQMSPKTGKWNDESCRKTALVVCQKKQEFDINLLKNVIEKLDNKLKDLEDRTQKELSVIKASPLPLGFIYIQLPNQSAPGQLFPNTSWQNVTPEYAGLFFRAQGKDSEEFGTVQEANSTRISNIQTLGGHYDSWKNPNWTESVNNLIEEGKWSQELIPGTGFSLYSLMVYNTAGENRPRNTAVKIWKRIK